MINYVCMYGTAWVNLNSWTDEIGSHSIGSYVIWVTLQSAGSYASDIVRNLLCVDDKFRTVYIAKGKIQFKHLLIIIAVTFFKSYTERIK